jgi:hypothetical protein
MNSDGNMSEKLDDLFFLKEDQKLIDQLKALKKFKETKEALSEISGIKNEHILQKLVELQVRPETLTSLSLIPLVEVAWADGNVDIKEKGLVLSCAIKMGFHKGGPDYEILSQWMTHRPSVELLDAWIHYIQGLCEKLTSEEKSELKKELIENTRSVAMASGGFLGLGNRISNAESVVLDKLESAFK